MELSDLALCVLRDERGHRSALIPVRGEDGRYSLERQRVNIYDYQVTPLTYTGEGYKSRVYVKKSAKDRE